MISQTAEYALRAMTYLAKRWPEPVTGAEIAAVSGVPSSYLSKILNGLSRGELVRSRRGKKGGFVLARDPADVALLDVIQAVDPLRRILVCPRQIPEHCAELCPLHRFLDDQIASLMDALGGRTVGELLSGHPAVFPN